MLARIILEVYRVVQLALAIIACTSYACGLLLRCVWVRPDLAKPVPLTAAYAILTFGAGGHQSFFSLLQFFAAWFALMQIACGYHCHRPKCGILSMAAVLFLIFPMSLHGMVCPSIAITGSFAALLWPSFPKRVSKTDDSLPPDASQSSQQSRGGRGKSEAQNSVKDMRARGLDDDAFLSDWPTGYPQSRTV